MSGATVLRLVFRTPHLPSVSETENALTVSVSTGNATPPSPIALTRQGAEGQMALSASVPGASRVLALDDVEAGDRILVVPARAGRGMLTPKRFVELMVLPSAAGLAVIPYADDIQATVRGEIVRFTRPQGLALSAGSGAATEPAIQVAESKEGPTFIDFAQLEPAGKQRARYDQVAQSGGRAPARKRERAGAAAACALSPGERARARSVGRNQSHSDRRCAFGERHRAAGDEGCRAIHDGALRRRAFDPFGVFCSVPIPTRRCGAEWRPPSSAISAMRGAIC